MNREKRRAGKASKAAKAAKASDRADRKASSGNSSDAKSAAEDDDDGEDIYRDDITMDVHKLTEQMALAPFLASPGALQLLFEDRYLFIGQHWHPRDNWWTDDGKYL